MEFFVEGVFFVGRLVLGFFFSCCLVFRVSDLEG